VNNMIRRSRLLLKQQSIIVFFVMMMVCCLATAKADQQLEKAQPGPSAPGFELQDMQGEKHQLKAYAGKTVIVNFWAVWCAPCRKEIPAMNRALAILKDENIAMLGINVGDQQEAIVNFSKDYPMDFTVLMDKNGAVSQHWQVTGFPTTYIVNRQGQVVQRFVGGHEWDKKSMLDSVRSIAAN
jgi:peroxiredoxin